VLQYINGQFIILLYAEARPYTILLLDSSTRVVQMQTNLKKCKEELLEKRNDLLSLWHKSQQHKEMLSILETMQVVVIL
jgi:hypothetical protein